MKVLSIGTDRLIFKPDSEVRQRVLDYGTLFEELHIIVFAKKSLGLKKEQLADNIFIYPTNSKNKLFYLLDAYKLGCLLLKSGPNGWIVTSQDPFETGLVAWLLKRKSNLKWQAQIHTDLASPYFRGESFLNFSRFLLAKFLLPRADKIRVVSLRIKKSLVGWNLKTEPVVLPIFVSKEVEKSCDPSLDLHVRYPQFSFVILMASRLTTEKNFGLALNSFSRAVRGREDFGLIIVGQGPESGRLQLLVKSLGVGKQVIFEDWQNNLSCYYKSTDLFMLTSNYEGYGRTLVEAGLNNCPVLTTEIGLVGEVINQQNALVCPVGDGNCLTEKISWAIGNEKELGSLRVKLREDCEGQIISNKIDYLNNYLKALTN